MLEGLKVSEQLFSKVKSSKNFRFDAEFFAHSASSSLEKILESGKFRQLKELTNYISSGHTPYKHDITQGEVKFITVECIDDLVLNHDKLKRVTKEQFEKEYQKNHAQIGSVICTIKRRICKAYAFLEKVIEPMAINQDVAIILPQQVVLPAYLATYLNCNIGQTFADKQKTGQMNPYISVDNLSTLPVFLPSLGFQRNVEGILKLAYKKLNESQTFYNRAEQILSQSLGLVDIDTGVKVNSNIKTFSTSFLESGRLDAEYYQQKYERLAETCFSKAVYTKTMQDIQHFNARGLQPEYVENGEVDVINSRHILEKHLDYNNFEKTTLQNWKFQTRAQVFKNDILIYTTGANIGRSQVYLKSEKALASNHVNILRIKNENPIYVAFVLNSKIGRLQTEQLSAGSAQQELYPKDIAQFYIPFISELKQRQISDSVLKSYTLQTESEKLLTLAKQAVETAIEQGEAAAEALLKAHLHKEMTA